MSARYLLPVHVFQRGFGEERVLLDMQSGDYFALNVSGAWMLDALLDGSSEAQVAARAAEHFEVDIERVLSDLQGLITEMRTRGLLLIADTP